ncbi:MAG: hypothetical protein ICV55_15745 [Coleofasciculus sp. C3-bin4]|nr:hypothetical protein [Coleofasciculus sp. C3-bin4]
MQKIRQQYLSIARVFFPPTSLQLCPTSTQRSHRASNLKIGLPSFVVRDSEALLRSPLALPKRRADRTWCLT